MNRFAAGVTLLPGAVQTGRADYVSALVVQALEDGVPAEEILQQGLLEGMRRLGDRFRRNEVYVPEVLVAARALNAGIELLRSALVYGDVRPFARAVLATVKGDMHDVGKNLVRMMLEGEGFEVIDLGVGAAAPAIVEAVRRYRPQILALSALLTSTMDQQRIVIEALTDAGLRAAVKVMVGGAPVTQKFCDLIGADAYAPDAGRAAALARQLVQKEAVKPAGRCAIL
jgi:5-methyltetrahydrofolate--homocysteine methyltransferase